PTRRASDLALSQDLQDWRAVSIRRGCVIPHPVAIRPRWASLKSPACPDASAGQRRRQTFPALGVVRCVEQPKAGWAGSQVWREALEGSCTQDEARIALTQGASRLVPRALMEHPPERPLVGREPAAHEQERLLHGGLEPVARRDPWRARGRRSAHLAVSPIGALQLLDVDAVGAHPEANRAAQLRVSVGIPDARASGTPPALQRPVADDVIASGGDQQAAVEVQTEDVREPEVDEALKELEPCGSSFMCFPEELRN